MRAGLPLLSEPFCSHMLISNIFYNTAPKNPATQLPLLTLLPLPFLPSVIASTPSPLPPLPPYPLTPHPHTDLSSLAGGLSFLRGERESEKVPPDQIKTMLISMLIRINRADLRGVFLLTSSRSNQT